MTRPRSVTLLISIALLAILVIGSRVLGPTTAVAATVHPVQSPEYLAERSKGSPTAPVRVVEMSDFQCPWCRKFTVETAAALDSEYVATGKVHWIFLNFPLTQLHPNAAAAAELAMCAAPKGKFWPMHDLLYRHQDSWATLQEPGQYFLTFADSLKIPRDSILPCLQQGQMRALVQRDANTSARIGATSTPSFLIEGALLTGAYPVTVFRHVIDSIYAIKTARH